MLENNFFGLNMLLKHDGLEILYFGPGIHPPNCRKYVIYRQKKYLKWRDGFHFIHEK